jgi:hypothetical protein
MVRIFAGTVIFRLDQQLANFTDGLVFDRPQLKCAEGFAYAASVSLGQP